MNCPLMTYGRGQVGTSLFLLQAFRVNSSYDRWWEGRKLWDQIQASSADLGRMALGAPAIHCTSSVLSKSWKIRVPTLCHLDFSAPDEWNTSFGLTMQYSFRYTGPRCTASDFGISIVHDAGWMRDKDLALQMLHWIIAFSVSAKNQLRHLHVRSMWMVPINVYCIVSLSTVDWAAADDPGPGC